MTQKFLPSYGGLHQKNPVRKHIIQIIAKQPATLGEIKQDTGMRKQFIRHVLKTMQKENIVQQKDEKYLFKR